jgi:hypothetical protein
VTHKDVGNAASRRERRLPRDAFAVSDRRQATVGAAWWCICATRIVSKLTPTKGCAIYGYIAFSAAGAHHGFISAGQLIHLPQEGFSGGGNHCRHIAGVFGQAKAGAGKRPLRFNLV